VVWHSACHTIVNRRSESNENLNSIFDGLAPDRYSSVGSSGYSGNDTCPPLDNGGAWAEARKSRVAKINGHRKNILRRRHLMLGNQIWIGAAKAAMEMPIGLSHIDSDLCWCDPIAEVDENGEEVVIHKEVTWN
jgi:hypothetical protein